MSNNIQRVFDAIDWRVRLLTGKPCTTDTRLELADLKERLAEWSATAEGKAFDSGHLSKRLDEYQLIKVATAALNTCEKNQKPVG